MAATVTNSEDIVTNSELSLEVIRLTAAAGDALEVAADNSATLIKHIDDMNAHGKDVDAAIKTAVDAHNTASTPHTGKFAAAAHDHHMGNLIGVLPTAKGGTGRSDGKAVALATARTIALTGGVTGSVNFDGSGNVNLSTTLTNLDASKITSGTLPAARGGTGRTDGRATALVTARTISLAGDVTGSANFDGSTNVSITAKAGSGLKTSLAERFFFGHF